jgi:hypothetical protein
VKLQIAQFLVGGIAALVLAACAESAPVVPPATVAEGPCPPDLAHFVRLEDAVRAAGRTGVTARSALPHLVQQKLPATGYYLSKESSSLSDGRVEQFLAHESGFNRPCGVGNISGVDAIVSIDPKTGEVRELYLAE